MSDSLAQAASAGSLSLGWVAILAAVAMMARQVGWVLLAAAVSFVVVAGFFAPGRQESASKLINAAGGFVSQKRHRRPWPGRATEQR